MQYYIRLQSLCKIAILKRLHNERYVIRDNDCD